MVWKDIPDFSGYQVSDSGLVRTHNKVTHTQMHGDRHWKDRILKPKLSKNSKRNQARVDLWKDGKPHTFLVSRLVAFTFYECDINDSSMTVNHIDGNWKNDDLNNLEIISLSDNIRHGFENGLYAKCKRLKVTDKETGEVFICRSEAEASRKIGKSSGYIYEMKRKCKHENDRFRWEGEDNGIFRDSWQATRQGQSKNILQSEAGQGSEHDP